MEAEKIGLSAEDWGLREEGGTGNGEGGRRDTAFLVRAKVGYDASERGAEMGLGVAGGQIACFPLDNDPAWEQPSGEWRRNGLRKSKRGRGQATLKNQERRKDWEYRVIAVNKAGEGAPRNSAASLV